MIYGELNVRGWMYLANLVSDASRLIPRAVDCLDDLAEGLIDQEYRGDIHNLIDELVAWEGAWNEWEGQDEEDLSSRERNNTDDIEDIRRSTTLQIRWSEIRTILRERQVSTMDSHNSTETDTRPHD